MRGAHRVWRALHSLNFSPQRVFLCNEDQNVPQKFGKKKYFKKNRADQRLLLCRDLNWEVTLSSFSAAVMKGVSKRPRQMWWPPPPPSSNNILLISQFIFEHSWRGFLIPSHYCTEEMSGADDGKSQRENHRITLLSVPEVGSSFSPFPMEAKPKCYTALFWGSRCSRNEDGTEQNIPCCSLIGVALGFIGCNQNWMCCIIFVLGLNSTAA